MWTAGDEPVVNAIRELRRGHWLASEGELVDGVLVMRPIRRRRRCCGDDLYLITEVRHPTYRSFTWSLRRCRHCERSYSIGPAPARHVGGRAGAGVHRPLLRLHSGGS